MSRGKKVLRGVSVALGVVLVAAGAFYGWAVYASSAALARTIDAHEVDIPVPFPLSEQELEELRATRVAEAAAEAPEVEPEVEGDPAPDDAVDAEAPEVMEVPVSPPADPLEGVDLEAIALERAVARGEHLVRARYACVECHGQDFGGGLMVDDPALGTFRGPNLTTGEGGVTTQYTIADWDRAIRHGVAPGGRPTAMPSEDYRRMTDQELSDVVAYIRSLPAVDREVEAISLGPLGRVLIATGALPLAADRMDDHHSAHAERPPTAEPTAEFGEHLAGVCTGCHRADFVGGPIGAGDPSWPPAANLTPHAEGLEGWTYEQFVTVMREGRRPDGTRVSPPMDGMAPYAERMTEVELQALWAYIQSLPAAPTGT